ncbi:unnamed protein product [Musa textilis]
MWRGRALSGCSRFPRSNTDVTGIGLTVASFKERWDSSRDHRYFGFVSTDTSRLLASMEGGILLVTTGILALFRQILLHVVGTDTFDLCAHLLRLASMPDDKSQPCR